jgi:hypothetical protein
MKALSKLLGLLFDPEDDIAVSNSQYAYHSLAQSSVLSGEVTLLSERSEINPIKVKTSDLSLLCINPIKGFRKDNNITKYRNFLLEIDTGNLQSQYEYIKKLDIPTSACIYSGNKSLHFLISLEDPIPNEKTYRYIYKWILNIATLVDQNVKNPSRCVRIPGVIRPDTGKEQRLLKINKRIKLEELSKWLYKYPESKPKMRRKEKLINGGNFDKLSPWVKKFIKTGETDFSKGRNRKWYASFYDMAIAGYNEEEAIAIMKTIFREESDFKKREWLVCCKSAYEHVLKR